MKRLLYVSSIFPPMVAGGAPRAAQFCRYLPEFGWAPTVLTIDVDQRSAVDDEALRVLPDSVEIVRAFAPLAKVAVRGAPNPRGGFAGWRRRFGRAALQFCLPPDRYIAWYPWAVKAGKQALRAKPHDAVLATFGPGSNLIVGAKLARWAKLPLIVDFRDLWGDAPGHSFVTPLHRRHAQWLEGRVARQASQLIAVAPGMTEQLRTRHRLQPEQTHTITNGFDPADRALAVDARPANGPYRICYAGTADKHHDFGPFLAALAKLANAGKITPDKLIVEFVGNFSPQEPARHGVERFVEVRPSVPHHEVFRVMAGADALLLLEPPGYWADYTYSAKLFDYLLTGKPVLALIEEHGNSSRLLDEASVLRQAHPQQVDEIAAAIESLLTEGRVPSRPVDIAAEPFCRFDRRTLAGKLAEVLDMACGKVVQPESRKLTTA